MNIDFENGIRLAGYELDRRLVSPGDTIHLTLYWSAWAPVPTNYTVFTHVRGDGNTLWAGHDGWPQAGGAPTVAWSVGNLVVDPHPLTLAADTRQVSIRSRSDCMMARQGRGSAGAGGPPWKMSTWTCHASGSCPSVVRFQASRSCLLCSRSWPCASC